MWLNDCEEYVMRRVQSCIGSPSRPHEVHHLADGLHWVDGCCSCKLRELLRAIYHRTYALISDNRRLQRILPYRSAHPCMDSYIFPYLEVTFRQTARWSLPIL